MEYDVNTLWRHPLKCISTTSNSRKWSNFYVKYSFWCWFKAQESTAEARGAAAPSEVSQGG